MPQRIDLIHRRIWIPPRPAPSRPAVIYNTVRQNIVQTKVQHIHNRVSVGGGLRREEILAVLRQTENQRERENGLDPARPTQAARTLVRIFSRESARRELRMFYSGVVRRVLREEQERYKSRPARAVSLIWTLLGGQNALRALTNVYLAAGVLIRGRYARRLEYWNLLRRGSVRETAEAGELLRHPSPRLLVLPEQETVEKTTGSAGRAEVRTAASALVGPEGGLSPSDFRALVQGVADTLGRRARLESLRRGGG